MYNTIRLLQGEANLTSAEYKKFSKGDCIWGIDRDPEENKRWPIEQEEEAKAELAKLHCEYKKGIELWYITEYALEYCEIDEDGNWIDGSDYDLAEEETKEV